MGHFLVPINTSYFYQTDKLSAFTSLLYTVCDEYSMWAAVF